MTRSLTGKTVGTGSNQVEDLIVGLVMVTDPPMQACFRRRGAQKIMINFLTSYIIHYLKYSSE